jgi:hypothetical protein
LATRIPAVKVQELVLRRLDVLAQDEDLLQRIVDEARKAAVDAIPKLKGRLQAQRNDLTEAKRSVEEAVPARNGLDSLEQIARVQQMVEERMERERELLRAIELTEEEIAREQSLAFDERELAMLLRFPALLFEGLTPDEQKSLIEAIVKRIDVTPEGLALHIHGSRDYGIRQFNPSCSANALGR